METQTAQDGKNTPLEGIVRECMYYSMHPIITFKLEGADTSYYIVGVGKPQINNGQFVRGFSNQRRITELEVYDAQEGNLLYKLKSRIPPNLLFQFHHS